MKKFLSFVLALALCLGLAAPAMAANGAETIPCQFDIVGSFSDGRAMVGEISGVSEDGTPAAYDYGFIDKTGKVVVPIGKYLKVKDFSDGLAAVQSQDDLTWGFINTASTEVVPCRYDDAHSFSEGLAAVGKFTPKLSDGRGYYFWGYIDATGTEVIPFDLKYFEAHDFSDGRALVERHKRLPFLGLHRQDRL